MTSQCPMPRLNSGIFSIFEPSEWNFNLISSECRTWKIISIDTKLEPISWKLKIENPFLNFSVGVGVGGHRPTNLRHRPKDAQENLLSFETNLLGANKREKTTRKMDYPLFYIWNQRDDQRKKLNTLGDFENQTPPTHFQKFCEFLGNWTKIFISPESA